MTLTQPQQQAQQQQIPSTQNQRMHMRAPEVERYNMDLTRPQQQQMPSTQNQRTHMRAPEVERYNMDLTPAQSAQRADYTNDLSQFGTKVQGGNSKSTGTTNAAPSFGNYDKTFQYSAAIEKAAKEGDYKKAAVLEYLMNKKIKGENLPYQQQNNYSKYLEGITQSDINMAKYGADVTPTGRYYQVGKDGKAPAGLKPGDYVVTGGGLYMITGVNDDGTYSDAVKVDGGTTSKNYAGTYDIPSPILQQMGLESPEGGYEAMRDVYMPGEISEAELNQGLMDQYDVERQQIRNQIDYATQTGVNELERAYEDALPTYASQRGQADIQGEKAAKNSALYAEQRGDRGGIGQAQYNALQIAKANQINQINTAQNKLASDTARQIADLRAKGEFEMADKMLSLAQNYLSQMNENKKWLANYNISRSQLDMQSRGQENDYLQMMAALTGRMPDGSLTADQAQRQVQNWQWLLSTMGYDPTGKTGMETLDKRKMDIDQSNYEREWQKALIDSLIEYGGIPSADSLSRIGYTDPQAQTAMQWAGQLQAIMNRYNILNNYGVDLPYAQGYPSTPPGSGRSVTSGGGVGTTSSSGSGRGKSSGSSKGSSSGTSSGNGTSSSNGKSSGSGTTSSSSGGNKSSKPDAVAKAEKSATSQANSAVDEINELLRKS